MTLLELLVAMALSSLIMLMVGSTIATSVRASGSNAVDRQQGRREDRGRALLSAQMSWIELSPDSREPRMFAGQSAALEFGTLISARRPHERSAVRARYAAMANPAGEGLSIVYYEWPAAPTPERNSAADLDRAIDALRARVEARAEQAAAEAPPSVTHTLVDRCEWVQFAYLYIGAAGERIWDLEWRDSRTMPRAVRISWATLEGVEGEWIVPVVATF